MVTILRNPEGAKILYISGKNTTVLNLAAFPDWFFEQSRTIEIEVVYAVHNASQNRIVQGTGPELEIKLKSGNNQAELSRGVERVGSWEGNRTYTAKYAKWRSERPNRSYLIELTCHRNHSEGWIGIRHISITQVNA